MIRMLTILALLLCSTVAIGQDKTPVEKPAEPVTKRTKEQPRITDPAVLAVLESKPETPAEQFDAARLLVDLGQPELAQPMLKKLIDAKLDTDALATLAEKFGAPVFLRFGRTEALAPDADQFASAVLAAAEKVARDPARVERL